jgi:hypothetical protein
LLKTLVPGVVVILIAVAVVALVGSGQKAPYTPGDTVEGITNELQRKVPDGFAKIPFVDVAQEAGIDFRHSHGTRSIQLPEDMGSGLAWGDYDGDGDPDLYVVNQAGPLPERKSWPSSPASNRLFRNSGDGTFVDVTAEAGVGVRDMGMAATWGDVDSDRDLDLLVTSYGSLRLFENSGDGTFVDVTKKAGLGAKGYWAGASWGDFDRDGDLDLYVCGYVNYTFDPEIQKKSTSLYASVIPASLNPSTYKPHKNVLFENDGSGRFTDVTERAGVANTKGRSLGAAFCDFDEDGWLDLYIANDISDNVLYRNMRDGTFKDSSHAAWVADYRGAMGLAITDWDSDHDLDMFVTHWIAQENALYVNLRSEQKELNKGGKKTFVNFQDDADQMGVGQIALDFIGWGTFFLDLDNDARPDLFVANGSTFQKEDDERFLIPMRPLLFWNKGPQHGFFDVGRVCGDYFSKQWVGRGAACADYDGDGDVDFAVVHNGERLALLQNQAANGNHWLGVRLRGDKTNTFGLGSKVTVICGESVQALVVGAMPSYLSQPDLTLHFGLAQRTEVERVEISWLSGKRQTLTRVKADQIMTVDEPK